MVIRCEEMKEFITFPKMVRFTTFMAFLYFNRETAPRYQACVTAKTLGANRLRSWEELRAEMIDRWIWLTGLRVKVQSDYSACAQPRMRVKVQSDKVQSSFLLFRPGCRLLWSSAAHRLLIVKAAVAGTGIHKGRFYVNTTINVPVYIYILNWT
jgi:hypothetical protein